MNQNKQATEEELKLMSQYGITHETKSVYFYMGYKYDKLKDAILYARDSSDHTQHPASSSTE
jgi:hypothetical protein